MAQKYMENAAAYESLRLDPTGPARYFRNCRDNEIPVAEASRIRVWLDEILGLVMQFAEGPIPDQQTANVMRDLAMIALDGSRVATDEQDHLALPLNAIVRFSGEQKWPTVYLTDENGEPEWEGEPLAERLAACLRCLFALHFRDAISVRREIFIQYM